MYKQADKGITLLNKRYVTLFGRLKNLTKYDERNVVEAVNKIFDEINSLTLKVYVNIAQSVYREITKDEDTEDIIDEMWVLAFLQEYDSITKYVYLSEADRKRTRLIEAMIASDNKSAEANTAMKIWSRQSTQACIEITDRAAQKAYLDSGIDKVIWETEDDIKVCEICEKRDGRVYSLENVPGKPHYNCRCWLRPFVEGKDIWNL